MDARRKVALLRACPLFDRLSQADLDHLAEASSARH